MSKHQYDDRPIGLDALHDEETISTAASGGKKGVKITMVGALDPVAIMEVARVAGYGANKYTAFNYLQGFEYSKAYNAMQRHLNLFWAGEDIDPESQRLHLGHAAIEAMFLISFYLRGIGVDDRPPRLDGDPPTLGEFLNRVTQEERAAAPREKCQHLNDQGMACNLMREANIHRPASEHKVDGTLCTMPGVHHAFVRPT